MIVYRDSVGFMVKVRFAGASPKRDHRRVRERLVRASH
jgi:hypothetical protein